MVDALASDRSDQSFGEAVLPRRAWGAGLVTDAHGAQSVRDGSAIDAIPIADHVARRLSPRECFGDLAPLGGGIQDLRPCSAAVAMLTATELLPQRQLLDLLNCFGGGRATNRSDCRYRWFCGLSCDPVRGRMGCDVDPDEVSRGQERIRYV